MTQDKLLDNKPSGNGHRSEAQKEAHRATISALRLSGLALYRIAKELGINEGTVRKDMKVVERRWRDQQLLDLSTIKARELERLDKVEAAAWTGYVKSTSKSELVVNEEIAEIIAKGPKGKGRPSLKKSKITTHARDGNVRFLEIIIRCIERRCLIVGADAPTTQTHLHLHARKERAGPQERAMRFENLGREVGVVDASVVPSEGDEGDHRTLPALPTSSDRAEVLVVALDEENLEEIPNKSSEAQRGGTLSFRSLTPLIGSTSVDISTLREASLVPVTTAERDGRSDGRSLDDEHTRLE